MRPAVGQVDMRRRQKKEREGIKKKEPAGHARGKCIYLERETHGAGNSAGSQVMLKDRYEGKF